MRGKRHQPAAREPHPDPDRELELLRILDLRASIARREALSTQYRDEISMLLEEGRDCEDRKDAKAFFEQADVLHQRIFDTEASITRTHEEIAAVSANIPRSDLSYLFAQPDRGDLRAVPLHREEP